MPNDHYIYVLSLVTACVYDGSQPQIHSVVLGVFSTPELAQEEAASDNEGPVTWCGRGFWDGKLESMTIYKNDADEKHTHELLQYVITRTYCYDSNLDGRNQCG